MKKQLKWMITSAILATTFAGGVNGSSYAADETAVYTLNPVVVTATRTEKQDLDVPATTTVLTAKEIKDSGYKNIFDAIDNQVGISSTGYGDAGQDFGLSSGRTIVRGFDRGTLVMVNGVPMNLKNYNGIDSIPTDMVEKVEIVRGASGTLYGAEAMGGVVNIITKQSEGKTSGSVSGTVGNYYKDYNVTVNTDRFIISAGKEYSDKYTHSNDFPRGSTYNWWIGKGNKDRIAISGKLTEELTANFFYVNSDITRGGYNTDSLTGAIGKWYNYRYRGTRATTGLSYAGKNNGIKATVGYNYYKIDGDDFISKTTPKLESNAKMDSYVADIQKQWNINDDSLIVGYTYRRENYEGTTKTKIYDGTKQFKNAHRNDNALYISYDKKFSDKFSTTFGLRGESYKDMGTSEKVALPQLQTLYKINDDTSWYINVGRAFQMPPVDSYYTSKNYTNIVPERGWNYETGLKKVDGNKSYKVAVYHMTFKNKFGWSGTKKLGPDGQQYVVNKGDFKNTGVELEFTNKVNEHWKYNLGLGLSNPKLYDKSAANPKWTQDSAKIDIAAGVTYSNEKLTSNITFKYLGDRESYVGSDVNYKSVDFGQVPSRIRLNWNTSYDITPNDSISLMLNNLLDRKNYANRYSNLDLPFNWRLSYSHKF